ncbi:MAG: Gfo/Idh/MocA family oxidoreductase [Spirochaetes bacterium]|nr:Gfo/Idh/MocA family oxidoreductase [Spirochaetota bacterium]MBU0955103.1 Gfo/Idh/MocA family oxidoreductase [Spirochaetota bacterium]
MKPQRIGLVGAGDRGTIYAKRLLSHSPRARLVAVADPDPAHRQAAVRNFSLAESDCHASAAALLEAQPELDALIIASPDQSHLQAALPALERGLHVLLEKPMVCAEEDLDSLLAAVGRAEALGGSLTVCHVLRYSPFFLEVKRLVDSGILGEVRSLYHAENVAWYHYAHSYVRGNWGNSKRSSPFVLAKSSHDLDLICWLLGERPTGIFSRCGRSVFLPANRPSGAPARCTDGCSLADSCIYEARKTYLYGQPLKQALSGAGGLVGLAAGLMLAAPRLSRLIPGLSTYYYWKEWPTSTISSDLRPAGVEQALRDGPYGRCVYACDNDQAEHVECLLDFPSGAGAVFRLHGHSAREGRTLRIDGSLGSLRARFGSGTCIEVQLHGESRLRRYPVGSDFVGHAAADRALVDTFLDLLDGAPSASSAQESALSHRLAFAAVRSAASGLRVEL